MPHVTVEAGPKSNPVYQVGGKSFVFFRTPRADATDPVTGERYDDVIVFWVDSDEEKLALVQDPSSPFFTTPHFNGHRRSSCEPVASARSPAKRWSSSSRTRGWPRPRPAGPPPGSTRDLDP